MQKTILNVIRSEAFAYRLNKINKNYPNLKQENHIRNCILELLNDDFLDSFHRAFAEHPREKSQRVDLSIVSLTDIERPFAIELKFQYTNDFKQFLNYESIIEKDFQRVLCNNECNMFILIISHWDKDDKKPYDKQWGIRPEHTLSRFLSLNENWKVNIENMFAKYEGGTLIESSLTVNEPYPTHYHFYIITRNA